MTYDEVLEQMEINNCNIHEMEFKSKAKGLCIDNNIFLNKGIDSSIEKKCILAEELGHVLTTYGNIIDRSKPENQKQELRARGYAYDLLIGLDGIVLAYQKHCRSIEEFVDFLEVTKDFFADALAYYQQKYGNYFCYKNYIIQFAPCFNICPQELSAGLKNKSAEYVHTDNCTENIAF